MTEENQDTPEQASTEPTETPAVSEPTPAPAPKSSPTISGDTLYFFGLGRRKTSVARVRLKPGGTGKITVNKRTMDDYFYRGQDRKAVTDPLRLTKNDDKFDVFVNVRGGGMTGQAGAARLGVARALAKYDSALTDMLRESGFLTRDARVSERKKYGQRGARASFQFSKR